MSQEPWQYSEERVNPWGQIKYADFSNVAYIDPSDSEAEHEDDIDEQGELPRPSSVMRKRC